MDFQCVKFVRESRRVAAGAAPNAREVVGKLLIESGFDPYDVEGTAQKAAKAAAEKATGEAKAILDRVVERYPRQSKPAPAGAAQVATPAPAVGTGG